MYICATQFDSAGCKKKKMKKKEEEEDIKLGGGNMWEVTGTS